MNRRLVSGKDKNHLTVNFSTTEIAGSWLEDIVFIIVDVKVCRPWTSSYLKQRRALRLRQSSKEEQKSD